MITKISNNDIDVRDKNKISGVYKINCEKCDMVYIGETGRTFKTRINEHEKSMKNKDEKSPLANTPMTKIILTIWYKITKS